MSWKKEVAYQELSNDIKFVLIGSGIKKLEPIKEPWLMCSFGGA